MKLVFNKRSGAVVMSPDSEGLGATVVAGVGSSLTQSSGISYFSLYTFFWSTCISIDPGPEFFVEVFFKSYICIYILILLFLCDFFIYFNYLLEVILIRTQYIV